MSCAALLAFGCSSPTAGEHRNSGLILPRDRLATLKQEAFGGEGAAAYRLFLHYSVGGANDLEGRLWLRLATRLGDANAKKYLRQWRISQPDEYTEFVRDRTLPSR
jgi:hypothetical protein